MVCCKDICEFLDILYPVSLSEDWDNCGLLIGRKSRDVKKILLCLDVGTETVQEAIDRKCQMIISHHPLIFKGLKRICDDNYIQNIVQDIIRNDICVYAAHTNMDKAQGGLNDIMAAILTLNDINILGMSGAEKQLCTCEYASGRYGIIENEMYMFEFVNMLKTLFDSDKIRFTGDEYRKIRRIALCTGSFDGNLVNVLSYKPDVFITGEMKYHDVLDMTRAGTDVVLLGHYESESIYKEYLKDILNNKFTTVETLISKAERNLLK